MFLSTFLEADCFVTVSDFVLLSVSLFKYPSTSAPSSILRFSLKKTSPFIVAVLPILTSPASVSPTKLHQKTFTKKDVGRATYFQKDDINAGKYHAVRVDRGLNGCVCG